MIFEEYAIPEQVLPLRGVDGGLRVLPVPPFVDSSLEVSDRVEFVCLTSLGRATVVLYEDIHEAVLVGEVGSDGQNVGWKYELAELVHCLIFRQVGTTKGQHMVVYRTIFMLARQTQDVLSKFGYRVARVAEQSLNFAGWPYDLDRETGVLVEEFDRDTGIRFSLWNSVVLLKVAIV